MKSPYETSPAKGKPSTKEIQQKQTAAIARNKEQFTTATKTIIQSASLSTDQKAALIGAEIINLRENAGGATISGAKFIWTANKELHKELKRKDYIEAGERYLAVRYLAIKKIAKAGGLAFVKKFKMTRAQEETTSVATSPSQEGTAKELAQEETASVASSSTGLSKPAIALISLAVVAVGAAVVSYLTIPATAIAMSTFASWITLQALPTAGLFLASKTGISALAITATVGLAVLALSYFSQSKSDERLQIESNQPGTESDSEEISNTVSRVVNNLVSNVVDKNGNEKGADTPMDKSSATL